MGLQLLEDEVKMRAANIEEKSPLQTTGLFKPSPVDDTASSSVRSRDNQQQDEQVAMLNYFSDLSKDILENARSAVEVLNDLLNYDKGLLKTHQSQ